MTMGSRTRAFLPIILLVLLLFPGGAAWAGEGCLRCHEGIESITETPVMSSLPCFACHFGNPEGRTEEKAHQGMYANPSDYRVVGETCGLCHPDEVEDSKKSLHATMAGVISGTRYAWGAQETLNPIYAAYDVKDPDGEVPSDRGAVLSLLQLPLYDPEKPVGETNHPVDDYLRGKCLRCHLWSRGQEQHGDYRASGCAACHVVYSDSGTYGGRDSAILSGQKAGQRGRPVYHRITKAIPVSQCLHCHNRGGRTGTSYTGLMESGAQAGGAGEMTHGRSYSHLTPDVHYQSGMLCIDCHTARDLHGDGNIYGKGEQAVEIECEDCHGSAGFYATLSTSRGNPLKRLKEEAGIVILTSGLDGREWIVPQTHDIVEGGSIKARTAMGLEGHAENLECYACHSRWAPQCYGCHLEQDLSEKAGDWINTRPTEDPTKAGEEGNRHETAHRWQGDLSYARWEDPALGVNSEGMVSPFVPGGQVVFTQTGPGGEARVQGKVFTTFDGLTGITHAPLQPHTVSREARTCEGCHAGRKALGLGTGLYDSRANGIPVPFGLDSMVSEDGEQLQGTAHPGARPFNREELERIRMVSVCISCHEAQTDAYIWRTVSDVTGFAKTDARHREIIEGIFQKGTRGQENTLEKEQEAGKAPGQ